MFLRLRGTSFENGIDAAFKYTDLDVFLFKRDTCICLNYSTRNLVGRERPIHEVFPCLVGTVFEAHIFKGRHYAHINATQRDSPIGYFIVGGKIRFRKDAWPYPI
jgi:hypothetical protein